MRLLGAIGFDWQIFLIQAVNFLVLFLVLNRLFFKPFIKALREEKAKALAWQNFSQKLAQEKDKWQKEKKRQKLNLTKQAEEILAQAEQAAKNLQKNIYEQAGQEAAEIIQKARAQAKALKENWRRQAEPSLRRQILAAAQSQLAEALAKFNLAEANDDFFRQLLAELAAAVWPPARQKGLAGQNLKISKLVIPAPKEKTAEAKLAQAAKKAKASNDLPAILEFSHSFRPEQEEELSRQLKNKFGRTIKLSAKKNKNLIIGYRLQAEGIILEASLSKELSAKIN